jgi:hypothetical protein
VSTGFDPCGRLAFGDGVHETLDVLTLDGGDGHMTEQRLYMPLDSAPIGGDRAWFFCRLSSSQQPARFGIGEIKVAKLSDGCSFACRAFLRGWIGAGGYSAENRLSFLPCAVGRPRRAVATDYLPTLAASFGAVFDKIYDGGSRSPPCSKPRSRTVPDDLVRLKGPDFTQPDPLAAAHSSPCPARPICYLATTWQPTSRKF